MLQGVGYSLLCCLLPPSIHFTHFSLRVCIFNHISLIQPRVFFFVHVVNISRERVWLVYGGMDLESRLEWNWAWTWEGMEWKRIGTG